jgi:hypothetical protein
VHRGAVDRSEAFVAAWKKITAAFTPGRSLDL